MCIRDRGGGGAAYGGNGAYPVGWGYNATWGGGGSSGSGATNRGGGGGGGMHAGSHQYSVEAYYGPGSGGSGRVVIRYLTPSSPITVTVGGTSNYTTGTANGYTYYEFKSSGTWTFA